MAEFKNELILQTESGQSVSIDLRNALVLSAAPTSSTAARVGMQAYVVSGGTITAEYVCTAVSGGVYTWARLKTDDTLTQAGTPADAKAAGDAIQKLRAEVELIQPVENIELPNWVMDNYYYDVSGDTVDLTGDTNKKSNSMYYFQIIDYKAGEKYYITGRGGGGPRLWCFVDGNGNILQKADADTTATMLPLTFEQDCTLLVQIHKNYEHALYKEKTSDAGRRLGELETIVRNMASGQSFVFGAGINCDFLTPTIPKFAEPADGEKLAYFYGLYDELAESYPDYVQKIDCDAEMAAAGIAKPNNLSNYPMYMYKFAPAFTPGASNLAAATISKPIKLYITTGTHGELTAVWDMYQTMRLVCEAWQTDANLEALRWECEIYIIPCSGLVTVDRGERQNINSVDLNRNCPTAGWAVTGAVGDETYTGPEAGSEYETKVFMHYLDSINPHVYIDHHNTSRGASRVSFYAEAKEQSLIDIAATVISSRSRKLRMRLDNVFPENNWEINGFVQIPEDIGSRCLYAYEQGYHSVTFETNSWMYYKNGEIVSGGTDSYSSTACTIAVDGISNFILLALKELAKRPYIPSDRK